MTKSIVFSMFLIFISCNLVISQGIEFFEGTWQEALSKAKNENKMIFVDSYTKWCGPCKKLQKNVFPVEEAGSFFNKNFVNFKIDMESQSGLEFGVNYPVRAYPTLFFIDYNGNVVLSHVGGTDVNGLIEFGNNALSNNDNSIELENEWNKGNREFDFVLKYVKSLNAVGKPTHKVTNDYLNLKPDINKDQKAVLLFEAVNECDSKLFDMMVSKEYLKTIQDIYSEKEISDKIYKACWNTVEKSFEFDVLSLQEEAIEKMKRNNKTRCSEFSKKIDLYNAENKGDYNDYVKAAEKYIEDIKDVSEKIKFINNCGENFQFSQNINELKESLAKQVLKKDKSTEIYAFLIKILIEGKKIDEARSEFTKAMKMAVEKDDQETIRTLKRYELFLQNSN